VGNALNCGKIEWLFIFQGLLFLGLLLVFEDRLLKQQGPDYRPYMDMDHSGASQA
jgi:hypothetical protein